MRKLLFIFSVFLLFFSGASSFTVEGFKPVYIPESEAKVISVLPPRDVSVQGKIYIKDQYIFVGDVNLGVHVIDNTDPRNPQKIAFIQIYGNHDISIKDNIMFADNLQDLVAINITDIRHPVEVKRVKDVYKLTNQHYPENVSGGTYFECVDPSKGIVVGWVPATLTDPDCWTSYNYFWE